MVGKSLPILLRTLTVENAGLNVKWQMADGKQPAF